MFDIHLLPFLFRILLAIPDPMNTQGKKSTDTQAYLSLFGHFLL